MQSHTGHLLRAALKIHEAVAGKSLTSSPRLPTAAWRQVVRSFCELRFEQLRSSAIDEFRLQDLRSRIADFQNDLHRVTSAFHARSLSSSCSLRSVYEDLLALNTEFEEVDVDLRARKLSVTTGHIELEEVQLGRFQICLRWDQLGSSTPYEIIALDPLPAATSDSTTHPHVLSRVLCEGEGRSAIRAALEQGRLLDFFMLVRQVLETYNAASAYVQLSDWSGVECSDCGACFLAEDASSCRRCGSDLCSDCSRCCGSCSQTNCSGCSSCCVGCDTDYCGACLGSCSDCQESFCSECLTEGRCSNCHDQLEHENEEQVLEEGSDQYESGHDKSAEAGTDSAVHPVCLGEAGVSA
jgi:hypothetical protein